MAINIRKLAALDIAFHGPKVILAEFLASVLFPLVLGLLSLFRGRAPWQTVFGIYLLSLALNYVPLLAYALIIVSRGSAQAEIAGELDSDSRFTSKYTRHSLLLLLPLVIPVLALVQLRARRTFQNRGSRRSPGP